MTISEPLTILVFAALVCAAIPAGVYLRNLLYYRTAPHVAGESETPVSLLIPARNEADRILPTLEAALASEGVDLEVVVLDDHSTDGTAEVVLSVANEDSRVRLENAPPLAPGWNGKQAACFRLASLASHEHIVFIDADVQLTPDALARSISLLKRRELDLLSGVPQQITDTFAERLFLPLIHFLLLGFLPMWRMRQRDGVGYAAGCGQFFVTTKTAYATSGGHAAIRQSMHDGLKLPRAYREAGLRTDLVDATDLASCRMYESAREVWSGLGKNAVEGLASPRMIVPASCLLFFGSVLPPLLGLGLLTGVVPTTLAGPIVAAVVLSYLPRMLSAGQFRQSVSSAVLHPFGVLGLLAIQWQALFRYLRQRPASWRGRSYVVGLSPKKIA